MKIAIAGANGRMGHMLIEAVLKADDAVLTGALDVPDSPNLGNDAGMFLGEKTGVTVESDISRALEGAEYLIDFTRPEGTLKHLDYCVKNNIKIIIGTTGFDEAGKKTIAKAAETISVVFAPNMSVGVNVTMKLLEIAAKNFAEGYDIEVIEAHHRHKVDAPSGTALKMGEVIANAIGRDLKECGVFSREGITGETLIHPPSDFQPFVVAISSVTIPFFSPVLANVSKSLTNPPVARLTRKAASGHAASSPTRKTAFSTCRTFLA